MASLLTGALARGISGSPVANVVLAESQLLGRALTRRIRGLAAARDPLHQQLLNERNFSRATVCNDANPRSSILNPPPSKPPRFRINVLESASITRNFEDVYYVTNNANSESQFFSQLARDRKVSILGIDWWLSFNQVMDSEFKGINLPPLNPRGSLSNPTEHEIAASASSLIKSVDRLVEDEPDSDIVPGAMYMIYTDPRFQAYNESAKLKVLSKVLDVIQHYHQADTEEVFHMRWYIKSSTVEDTKDLLSKKQIKHRVVDVVKSYHGVPKGQKASDEENTFS